MTDHLAAVLNELVPRFEEERGDWVAVARDAGAAARADRQIEDAAALAASRTWTDPRRPRRRFSSRRLVLAAAVVVVIAAPLAAVATAQNWWPRDWWFFRFGDAPTPVTEVNVVKTGSWDGMAWQLVAYGSSTDGICFGIAPADTARTTGTGAGMACDRIDGVPPTPQSKPSTPHAITYMWSSSGRLPPNIVGPVIDTADAVEIHFTDGSVVRTTTFEAPKEFGSIRFYATRLPQGPRTGGVEVRKLVGLDRESQIVACLIRPMPEEGVPLSACR
jgi:hypothetical protein